jgi:hypothetical protein
MRYEQELGLEQIARLAGLAGSAQVEREIQRALATLRDTVGAVESADVSVKEG